MDTFAPSISSSSRELIDSVVNRFAGDSGDGMQLTGSQFADSTALMGNDLSTLPDFPAEIRAPAGTTFGVSGFQVHFAGHDIKTPGDAPDVLVAMNPAALRVNLRDLKIGGLLVCNSGAFTAPEIAEGVGAVVLEMRRNFPNAKILMLAIFPRSVPGDPVRDKIAEVNRLISRLDDQQNVFYMDIGDKFLDQRGYFLPDTFRPDNLHPVVKGYDIWGEAVSSTLAGWLK